MMLVKLCLSLKVKFAVVCWFVGKALCSVPNLYKQAITPFKRHTYAAHEVFLETINSLLLHGSG